jgi:hypothetical protein
MRRLPEPIRDELWDDVAAYLSEIERLRAAVEWLCEHADDTEASRDEEWFYRLAACRALISK